MGCIYTLAVKGALLGKWLVKAISHWPKEHKKWGFCQLGKSQHHPCRALPCLLVNVKLSSGYQANQNNKATCLEKRYFTCQ